MSAEPLHLLFTDETNNQPVGNVKFFIYGGLFVPASRLRQLHDSVEGIRRSHGFRPGDDFKFAPQSRPGHVTRERFRDAKRALLQLLPSLGVTFVASLTLHELAKNKKLDELVGFGANTIAGAFNQFLGEVGSDGLWITDRLPFEGGFKYLCDRFQVGLRFPNGSTRRLERVLGAAVTCEGASHAMSVADITIGAFRYCVNEAEKTEAPKEMLPRVAAVMWAREQQGKKILKDRGLLFRPKTVDNPNFRREYDELATRLQNLLAQSAQG